MSSVDVTVVAYPEQAARLAAERLAEQARAGGHIAHGKLRVSFRHEQLAGGQNDAGGGVVAGASAGRRGSLCLDLHSRRIVAYWSTDQKKR